MTSVSHHIFISLSLKIGILLFSRHSKIPDVVVGLQEWGMK